MLTSPVGEGSPDAARPASRVRWIRLGLLFALLVAVLVVARWSGFAASLTAPRVRAAIDAAGPWGFLLFLAAFSLGEFCQVPGMVFVAAAVFAWGRTLGGGLALLGAMVSLAASFLVVRAVGGKPLEAIRWRFLRRLLDRLDTRPVRTIALLRLVLWMAPQLNYALALSGVRFSAYLAGSAIGLLPPLLAAVLAFDWFFG